MYESVRAYHRRPQGERQVFMNALIHKMMKAREYIISKGIEAFDAFDPAIPWPEGLK